MNTKEKAELMLAFDRGETDIEIHTVDGWEITNKPMWNWGTCDYRAKPKIKEINLSHLIGSDIDMEFSDNLIVDKLIKIDGFYRNLSGTAWIKCRVRENHWHNWNGGECPLPEGLNIIVKFRDGTESIENMMYFGVTNWIHTGLIPNCDFIAFKVIGTKDGWEYKK